MSRRNALPGNLPRARGVAGDRSGDRDPGNPVFETVIREFTYEDYADYVADRNSGGWPWDTLLTLREENPEGQYGMRVSVGPANLDNFTEAETHAGLRDTLSETFFAGDSDLLRRFFAGELTQADSAIKFRIVSLGNLRRGVRVRQAPVRFRSGDFQVSFRYPSISWRMGPLSNVAHCVLRHMTLDYIYYTFMGDRRESTWIGEERMPVKQAEDKILHSEGTYRAFKAGVKQFMQEYGVKYKGIENFAMDFRHIIRLAECTDSRIKIYVPGFHKGDALCAFDTSDHFVPASDMCRIFHYMLCNTGHVAGIRHSIRRGERSVYELDVEDAEVKYIGDEEFDRILTFSDRDPEELSVLRLFVGTKKVCPVDTRRFKYPHVIVTDGVSIYKHESLKPHIEEWIQAEITEEDPDDYPMLTALSSYHLSRLKKVYVDNNVFPISQKRDMRSFMAVSMADHMTTHVKYSAERPGAEIYEFDFQKFYLTNFSDLEGFDFFHGYPANPCFSEYQGPIGNLNPQCTPFTWARSDKYAVFLIDKLNFAECRAFFPRHLRRDSLFMEEFNTADGALFLPSPIVHFLESRGVRWSASTAWVCHATMPYWVPMTTDGKTLVDYMKREKTYPMVMGSLMSGRKASTSVNYLCPDKSTAEAVAACFAPPSDEEPGVIYKGISRDTNPGLVLKDSEGNIASVSNPISCSTFAHKRVETSGYNLQVNHDMWGFGKSFCHISGAQHAYCFVRLYSVVRCLHPDRVTGFSLDSIRVDYDASDDIREFISREDRPGFLKPVSKVTVPRVSPDPTPASGDCLITEQFTPKIYLEGPQSLAESNPDPIRWSKYHDGLGRFNLVVGPAGSGKTSRHFENFDVRHDTRLDKSATRYCTLTNYLTQKNAKEYGVKALTSHKMFNRKVNDKPTDPDGRYQTRTAKSNFNHGLSAFCNSIFADEVTMMNPDNIRDMIRVCEENHLRLFLTGDFDPDSGMMFQLTAPNSDPSAYLGIFKDGRFSVVPPQKVYRQSGDEGLTLFFSKLRDERDVFRSWDISSTFEGFRHISYDEMLREANRTTDFVIMKSHQQLYEFHKEVLQMMNPEDKIRVRSFHTDNRRRDDHPDTLESLICPDTGLLMKGAVGEMDKEDLQSLEGSSYMAVRYPYAGEGGKCNKVNPALGMTAYALQGVTLKSDAKIYIVCDTEAGTEWQSRGEPRFLYVILSRIQKRGQVAIVYRSRSRPGKRPRVQ